MGKNEDILANLDILENQENIDVLEENTLPENHAEGYEIIEEIIESHEEIHEDVLDTQETTEEHLSVSKKISDSFIFIIKYISTSICIFGVLLVVSNYSAYWNVVHSIIYAEEMEHTKKSLIESVAAASVSEKQHEEQEVDTFKGLQQEGSELEYNPSMHSLTYLSAKAANNIDLNIEITPYENRVIIPKIGKNIPLIDITQKKVTGVDELNNIFMEELEKGIIRYPGSAKPGENGNSFIFGHSSNFPWIEGEYNDVFSLLDNVVFDDDVIVYYGQEKYTYKIRTKDVIRPGDVSVLKSDDTDTSKITLMTCWPIGTTLNRLILTGDLVSIE